jgi:hypothetical protein
VALAVLVDHAKEKLADKVHNITFVRLNLPSAIHIGRSGSGRTETKRFMAG